jgi:hypothetical protein
MNKLKLIWETESHGQTQGQTDQVMKLLQVMKSSENKRSDLMNELGLSHNPTFRDNYIKPAINLKYIDVTQPESPNSPIQAYKLTKKGKQLKKNK